jgi:hypothetical protein
LAAADLQRTGRRGALGALALAGVLAGPDGAFAEAAARPAVTSPEAAYLSRLPEFVQWPDAAFESPAAPFNICIVADDEVGAKLEPMVASLHFGRRPVQVKRLQAADSGLGCQVLYLGAMKGPALEQELSGVRDAPVLTVTEGQGPEDPKGVIEFQQVAGRLRLAVDQTAARRSGLMLSSKLLELADPARIRRGGDGA